MKHHSLKKCSKQQQYALDGKQTTSLHTDALT
jgi:hypothetical protein